jgi:hypothetical protein
MLTQRRIPTARGWPSHTSDTSVQYAESDSGYDHTENRIRE